MRWSCAGTGFAAVVGLCVISVDRGLRAKSVRDGWASILG